MEHTATYSPEDNKLRLYPACRLSQEDYDRIKAAGFRWAPKQELFVAPRWSPGREDVLLEMVDEIGDEDYSREERAADRAERFSGYRDKRRAEAGGLADAFDAGPSVHGYASARRAMRAASRHDRYRTGAVSQWEKAEYWQYRTQAVISHHLYKSSPEVRRLRILRLESEQRKHLAGVEQAIKRYKGWELVKAQSDPDKAFRMAYILANVGGYEWYKYKHPRTGREASIYSLLTDEENPLTGHEAAELWLTGYGDPPGAPGGSCDRWSKHYELRLAYERAMLDAEGGTVAAVEMEPGGFIGEHQIYKVHKSPATGRVTSVTIKGKWGFTDVDGRRVYTDHADADGFANMNIERLGADVYRAPTNEERAAFEAEQKKLKAKKQAKNAAKPKLINPTMADAEKLQAIWNKRAYAKGREPDPSTVLCVTQAEYSARSQGTYSSFDTSYVTERGETFRKSTMRTPNGKPVFKVRTGPGARAFGSSRSVVVITDKPQKPIPWETMREIEQSHLSVDEIMEQWELLVSAVSRAWLDQRTPEEVELFDEAEYRGLVFKSSMSQFSFTEKGASLIREKREAVKV